MSERSWCSGCGSRRRTLFPFVVRRDVWRYRCAACRNLWALHVAWCETQNRKPVWYEKMFEDGMVPYGRDGTVPGV